MDQLWKKVWAEFNWSQFGSSKCLKRSAEIAIITSWGSDKNLDGGFGQTRKQDERGSSITRAKLEETHTNWEYAGLTGSRLDGAEMLACGLATHFVSSDVYSPSLIFSLFFPFTIASIGNQESEALDKKDDWISSTIQSLKKAPPTSLKISLRSIREGRLQGVGSCLVRVYRMACHLLRGEFCKDFYMPSFSHPFYCITTLTRLLQGCRAILIDRDRNPKWEPSRLETIRDDDVDRYFSKIDDEDWEDLKLPPRSNMSPYAIAKL